MSDARMTKQDITYYSNGLKIAAHLYLPADWTAGDPARTVLFVVAEYDSIVPPEEIGTTNELCGEPKELVRPPGARHNRVYEILKFEYFETVASEASAWFRQYL